MKPAPPLLANLGTAVFGAENEMALKAEVRGWHASVRHPSRAHHVFGSVSRWLRRKAALPPANFRGSSGAPIQKPNKTSRVFARTCTTAKFVSPGVLNCHFQGRNLWDAVLVQLAVGAEGVRNQESAGTLDFGSCPFPVPCFLPPSSVQSPRSRRFPLLLN